MSVPDWVAAIHVSEERGPAGARLVRIDISFVDPPPEFIDYLESCLVLGLPFAVEDFATPDLDGAIVRDLNITHDNTLGGDVTVYGQLGRTFVPSGQTRRLVNAVLIK